MKKLLAFCSGLLLGWSATATVIKFSTSSLPSQFGEYNCSYFSTNNLNVAAMLTLVTNSSGPIPPPAGPTWDFSQLQQSNETVLRTDIINPAAGTDGGDFPAATYAEQDSQETLSFTNLLGWRYYSFTNQGRIYYGSYEPGTALDGLALYDPPIVDVPAAVTNGQAWTLSTAWNSTIYGIFPLNFQFSATVTADAYGTLVLPNLGAMPAWRVHEVDQINGYLEGSLAESVTDQYYYWLVPGLGVAVEITLYDNDGSLPFTNSVQRMFYASYFTNSPPLVPTNTIMGDLHIQLQSGSVVLNWNTFINNPSNYQVQANGVLNSTNWQSLGLTSGTNWTDILSPTQRFYRVVGSP